MTNHESYVLGWVYGKIRSYDKNLGWDNDIASPRPFSANANILSLAHQNGILKGDLDLQVMEALSEIDSLPEMDGGSEKYQPLENQGSWQLGYYAGLSGKPLSRNEFDIALARKKKELTQLELAEQMGVDQALVSRWESGKVHPNAENVEKLKKILL